MLVLVLLAVGLSYLILVQVREQSQIDEYVEGRVAFQIEDFELDELNAAGELVYRIRGSYWEHDQWQERANFRQATMNAFDAQRALWQASAEQGHVNAEGSEVVLEQSVVMNYRHQGEAAQLTTERMTLFPHEQRFQTDSEVVILRGESRITGSAMRGDLSQDSFEIDNMQSRVVTMPADNGDS